MTYFDDYITRIGYYGTSEANANHNLSVFQINQSFASSPNYRLVKINNVDVEVRYLKVTGKDGFKHHTLLFRPGVSVSVGSLVQIDTLLFLVTDAISDSLKFKATLTMCNCILKWQNSSAVLKTYNATVSKVSRYKIIASHLGSPETEEYLYVYVQRNADTDLIVPSQRFILAGKTYYVMGVDNMSGVDSNRVGISEISLNKAVDMKTDDFINGIADNSLINAKNKVINQTSWGSGKLW